MRGRWLAVLASGVAGAALLAVSCASASGPVGEETTPQRSKTSTPDVPAGEHEAAMKKTVSGIPLYPDAKFGGVMTIASTIEGPTFSEWEETAGIPFLVSHKLLNMIVRNQTWGMEEDYANNAFFTLHPDLATSWEQSEDGMQWVFKFRDGVTWSDGVPLTCADAKWSLDTIRTGEGLQRSPRAAHFLAVDNIQCTDDLTMVINMKRPKPALLEVIGMPYHTVRPKHAYESDPDLLRTAPPSPTTGPYLLNSHIFGEKYVFRRNADYWDQPLPYLDGIEVVILDSQAVTAGVRAGRIHVGSLSGVTGASADALLAECTVCAFWERSIDSSISPGLMLNHQRAPWSIPEVKDAFSLAIDRARIVQLAYNGWSVLPTGCGFYPTGPWAMPEERCAQIPGYDFSDPKGNKERARKLLAQAGYAPGEIEGALYVWNAGAELPAAGVLIQEDLRDVGIDVEIELLEPARAYAAWSDGDFDIGLHSFWVAGLDPDVILYEHFYTGSERNYNRYSNPLFDRLVDEMSQTLDPELRKRRAWDAMELALREQAKIIVAHSTHLPAFNEKVRGFIPSLNYLAYYGPLERYDHAWLAD